MKQKIIFGLIVFLAFLLRFYQLDKTPASLNIDEVAIGFSAYSILQTGRDEFGKVFPLVFRSYDDYKPPLQIYLTVPSVALFGLNDFAVRFPGALFGLLTVIVTYFLAMELFQKRKIALLGALLMAIFPWAIWICRSAFEVGTAAFFTSFGLWLFLRGIKKNNMKMALFSITVFSLETYLYQASKVFIPMFVIALIIVSFAFWKKRIKNLILFGLVFGVCLLPNLWIISSGGAVRFSGTSVFQDGAPMDQNTRYQQTDWLLRDRISAEIMHPKSLAYLDQIVGGYLSHFRGDFLFLGRSGAYNNYFPPLGLLNLWELPLIIVGLYVLFFSSKKKEAWIILSGILLSPLPAAMTYGVPNPIRVALMIPFLPLASGFGGVFLYHHLVNHLNRKRLIAGVTSAVCLLSLAFVTHITFIHDRIDNAPQWYFGMKEAALGSQKLASNYSKIIVSTDLGQPHEFFLYYLKYDPQKYLQNGGTVSGGFSENRNSFENYSFRKIDWEKDKNLKNVLFVGRPENFSPEVRVLTKIQYPSGKDAIYLVNSP